MHNVHLLCNKPNTFTSYAWTGATTGAGGQGSGKAFNDPAFSLDLVLALFHPFPRCSALTAVPYACSFDIHLL